MEIVLHQRGRDERFVDVEPGVTAEAFAADCAEPGAFVWIEDSEQPLDPAAALDASGLGERGHVHVSSCETVTVEIRYGGDDRRHEVSPAITAGVLLERATGPGGFGMTDSERARHSMTLRGSDTEIDWAGHVGSFAGEDCVLRIDILPKERFQGR